MVNGNVRCNMKKNCGKGRKKERMTDIENGKLKEKFTPSLTVDKDLVDVLDQLENIAVDIKVRQRNVGKFNPIGMCHHCRKNGDKTLLCSKCNSGWYCSVVCQKADWLSHKISCRLISSVRGSPGFNDYIPMSNFFATTLIRHGKNYLSPLSNGVVAFIEYPESKKSFLEENLRHSTNTASMVHDPVRGVVFHYFIVPLKSIKDSGGEGGFSDKFIEFVSCSKTYSRFIPIVQMRMDEKNEVSSMKFAALLDSSYFS